jgi:hypothetical protein
MVSAGRVEWEKSFRAECQERTVEELKRQDRVLHTDTWSLPETYLFTDFFKVNIITKSRFSYYIRFQFL